MSKSRKQKISEKGRKNMEEWVKMNEGFFEGIVGGGQALWQGGGRNVRDYYPIVIYLAFVFIAAP